MIFLRQGYAESVFRSNIICNHYQFAESRTVKKCGDMTVICLNESHPLRKKLVGLFFYEYLWRIDLGELWLRLLWQTFGGTSRHLCSNFSFLNCDMLANQTNAHFFKNFQIDGNNILQPILKRFQILDICDRLLGLL